jgi:phosphopantetheinyl transferase
VSAPAAQVAGNGPRYSLLHRPGDPQALRVAAAELSVQQAAPYLSRSYREPFALVAWHTAPVGIDLERVEDLSAELARSIATPEERQALGHNFDDPRFVASMWSAKEAVAKCLGDALDYDPRRLVSPLLWRDGAAGRLRAAELGAPEHHVAWICWAADERATPSIR